MAKPEKQPWVGYTHLHESSIQRWHGILDTKLAFLELTMLMSNDDVLAVVLLAFTTEGNWNALDEQPAEAELGRLKRNIMIDLRCTVALSCTGETQRREEMMKDISLNEGSLLLTCCSRPDREVLRS